MTMKLSVLSMMVLLVGAPAIGRAQDSENKGPDLESTYQNLKDAVAKGRCGGGEKAGRRNLRAGAQGRCGSRSADADEKDAWTKRVAYAKTWMPKPSTRCMTLPQVSTGSRW
jgi:hypothetical protein